MKEKILAVLKTKFDGVKDEILDRIATKASKTIKSEDEVATYVEGVTYQTVLDAYGDFRATEAQKSAVANYEKKHGIKDGKKIEEPKPDEPKPNHEPEDVPAWAKAIVEGQQKLNERFNALEGEKTANSRKSKLNTLVDGMPDREKNRLLKDFERSSFKDDEDFDSWLEETKTYVNEVKNDATSQRGILTPPKSNSKQTGAVNPIVQARVDAMKADDGGNTASVIKG